MGIDLEVPKILKLLETMFFLLCEILTKMKFFLDFLNIILRSWIRNTQIDPNFYGRILSSI
jgi:hypothetical protein